MLALTLRSKKLAKLASLLLNNPSVKDLYSLFIDEILLLYNEYKPFFRQLKEECPELLDHLAINISKIRTIKLDFMNNKC